MPTGTRPERQHRGRGRGEHLDGGERGGGSIILKLGRRERRGGKCVGTPEEAFTVIKEKEMVLKDRGGREKRAR